MGTKTKKKSANKKSANKKAASQAEATPSYLGLLNAITVGETEAERFLLGWANVTDNPEVEKALRFVAMREGEHGKAFAKRMLELGHEVRWPSSERSDAKFAMACSSMSDHEKFEAFNVGKAPGGADVFDAMFENKDLDPATGGLLGRYIAEERDSGRVLNEARLCAATVAKHAKKSAKKSNKKKSKK